MKIVKDSVQPQDGGDGGARLLSTHHVRQREPCAMDLDRRCTSLDLRRARHVRWTRIDIAITQGSIECGINCGNLIPYISRMQKLQYTERAAKESHRRSSDLMNTVRGTKITAFDGPRRHAEDLLSRMGLIADMRILRK